MRYPIEWCISEIRQLRTLISDDEGALPEIFVLKAGDAMTGPLVLSGPPTTNLHAATKNYVDGLINFAQSLIPAAGNGLVATVSPSTLHVMTAGAYSVNAPLYADSISTLSQVALNAAASNKFLRQISSGVPSFETILSTDISNSTFVTSVSATSPITSSGGLTPTISTSMATGKLIGRNTAGVGVMEEITDIPTAITIGSAYIYRVGGTDVAVTDGGLNLSTVAQGDLLYGSALNTYSQLAKSIVANSYLKNSGVDNNPAWATITPADITSPATLAVSGAITISAGTGTGATLQALTLAHSTADGYVHVPSGGATTQLLQWSSTGTAKWITLSGGATIADGGAVTVTSGGVTYSGTQYGVAIYPTATTLGSTAAGTAGQILTAVSASVPIWTNAAYPFSVAQGDLLYASAANTIVALTKTAVANSYLKNSGMTNNPAWATITPADITSPATLAVSGAITISAGTGTGATLQALTISHSTADGYVHTPSGGAAAQILQYSSAGTAKWITMSGHASIADNGAVTVAITPSQITFAGTQWGLAYYPTATTLGTTAAGSSGQLLQSAGAATPVWTTATYPANAVQGDLLYGSALNVWSSLGKDANATRYLSNTGASNNPAWAQVNLANGVTGDLPFSNIAQIATGSLLGRNTALTGDIEVITDIPTAITIGSAYIYRAGGTDIADGDIASATNWNTAYTNRITALTVTGSSGASTLISNTLNIPTYTLSGLGGVGGSGSGGQVAYWSAGTTLTGSNNFVYSSSILGVILTGADITYPINVQNGTAAAAGVGAGYKMIGVGGAEMGAITACWDAAGTVTSRMGLWTSTGSVLTEKWRILTTGFLEAQAATSITTASGDLTLNPAGSVVVKALTGLLYGTAGTVSAVSLTTTGSSGASTLSSSTLNIPTYTLAGLGGFANPMTTLGDVIYGGASGVATRLAGNTTTTRKFLKQVGDGANSAAPAWDTVTQTDVGLSNVENTALSTWVGSTNIITLGTVTTGTWNATTIGVTKGGTGKTTITGVVIGDGSNPFIGYTGTQYGVTYWGTSATLASTAAGTAGDVLIGALASAPVWGKVNLTTAVSGDLPFANIAQLGAYTVAANDTAGTADIAALVMADLSGDGAAISITTGTRALLHAASVVHSTADGYKHIPSGGTATYVLQYASAGTAAWFNLFGTANTWSLNNTFSTSITTPLVLAAAALELRPTAGNNLNITTSGAGDVSVNNGQLYVDSSLGYVGVGGTVPERQFHVHGLGQLVAAITDAGDKTAMIIVSSSSDTEGAGGGIAFSALNVDATYRPQWAFKSLYKNGLSTADFVLSGRAAGVDTALTERLRVTPAGVFTITGTLSATGGITGVTFSGTQYGLAYYPTTTTLGTTAAGTSTTVLHGNAAGAPTWGAVSLTADVTGDLPFANIVQIATGSLLGRNTAGTGDIEVITDIPTAITIGSAYIYRAGGTDIPVTDGGTGVSTLADGGLVVGNGTSAVEVVAAGLTTQILVGGGAATNPAWGTDLPTAVTIGGAYIYRVGGTDISVADGGTGLSSWTANGIVYASGTGTLANGSALTWNGSDTLTFNTASSITTAAGALTLAPVSGSNLLLTTLGAAGGVNISSARSNDGALIVTNTDTTNGYGMRIQGGGTASGRSALEIDDATGLAMWKFLTVTGSVGFLQAQFATSITTAAGALTIQPAAGSNLNVTLATTGDFAVNTNQLYVDTSAGNVGIGTTTPGDKLQVAGNIMLATAGIIYTPAAIGAGGWSVGHVSFGVFEGTQLGIATYDTQPIQFAVNNVKVVTLLSGGNVGIGTTSPSALLDVRGSAIFNEDSADVDFRVESNDSPYAITVDGGTNRIGLGGYTVAESTQTGTVAIRRYAADSNVLELYRDSAAAGWGINVENSATGRFDISKVLEGTTGIKFTILDSGNVGIGNTSPGNKLDVTGSQLITGNLLVGSSGTVSAARGLVVYSVLSGSGTNQIGFEAQTTCEATTITNVYGALISMTTPADAGCVISYLPRLRLGATTKGAGSSISVEYGLLIDAVTGGSTNYAIYSSGAAITYLAGNLGIKNSAPSNLLDLGTAGASTGTLGFAGAISGTVVLTVAAAAGSWTLTLPTTAGSNGYALVTNGSGVCSWASVGSGTVTSVGLSAPSQFAVSGSPVSSSGALALAWNNQTANYGLMGPTSGGAAAPTFRALVAADMSALLGANNTWTQTQLTTKDWSFLEAASTSVIIYSSVSGDSYYRFKLDTAGKMLWGPGNVDTDTNLYRSAADTLKTDDAFIVGGNVGFYGTTPVAQQTASDLAGVITALKAYGLLAP